MTKYIFLFLFVSGTALANGESIFSEIARLRQYASGADESDLKVQPVLSQSAAVKKKKLIKPEPTEGF